MLRIKFRKPTRRTTVAFDRQVAINEKETNVGMACAESSLISSRRRLSWWRRRAHLDDDEERHAR